MPLPTPTTRRGRHRPAASAGPHTAKPQTFTTWVFTASVRPVRGQLCSVLEESAARICTLYKHTAHVCASTSSQQHPQAATGSGPISQTGKLSQGAELSNFGGSPGFLGLWTTRPVRTRPLLGARGQMLRLWGTVSAQEWGHPTHTHRRLMEPAASQRKRSGH